MAQNEYYEFKELSLGKLEFTPASLENGLIYEVSLVPEINEENESNVRITVKFKLLDAEENNCIFYIEDTAYFTISDGFGEFNIENEKVKEMIDIIMNDIDSLVYDISTKSFDKPIELGISAKNFVEQAKNSNKEQ